MSGCGRGWEGGRKEGREGGRDLPVDVPSCLEQGEGTEGLGLRRGGGRGGGRGREGGGADKRGENGQGFICCCCCCCCRCCCCCCSSSSSSSSSCFFFFFFFFFFFVRVLTEEEEGRQPYSFERTIEVRRVNHLIPPSLPPYHTPPPPFPLAVHSSPLLPLPSPSTQRRQPGP